MYFHRIISSSVQMTDQIKDVLEWSGYAKTKEPFSPVDLNSIIDSVRSDLEILIKQKRAQIQSSDLPVVTGSRLQLIRLFSNLINNALKFCNEAPLVTISSRALTPKEVGTRRNLDGSAEYVEVAVTDNGIGFKQEYADKIFRIFQRLHGHHEYRGTGIGLAICKKIAENHHGDIYATSDPGKGATFSIILPLATQSIVAASETQA
jgi:signal transduction histidine kinase